MAEHDDTPDQLDAQIAKVSAELEQLNAAAEADVAAEATGTALAKRTNAEEARAELAQMRAQATRTRNAIQAKAKQMRELQRRQVRALEARMSRELERMERMMAPLRDQLSALEEMVWTVNLYLGRDEEIVRLAEGDPAPVGTPVTIRQMVLAMDQECAVASEQGGIDSLDHEKFDAWLQEDWAHVEQVIPEAKGVVALVPRWNSDMKIYEDEGTTRAAAQGNEQTYFLIRNGANLYRTWTEFTAGDRLLPKRDEWDKFFRRHVSSFDRRRGAPEYEVLEPGSDAWAKAEAAASARQRHYMRVALILEGLLHRTTLFHPVSEGVSFVDPRSHEAGHVRFVMDMERTLGTGREPFRQWQERLNAQLRPGMRIVGNFSRYDVQRELRGEDDQYSRRRIGSRIYPNGAEVPPTGKLLTLERKDTGEMVVRYERTEEVYDPEVWVESETRPGWGHYGAYRKPKQRASCEVDPTDDWIIPFDLVTEAEVWEYLRARTERHDYVALFPTLKAVLRAKADEREAEAPFWTMLTGVLARDTSASVEQVQADLPELVHWFKLSNRIHRPLVGDDEAKAVRLITAEYKRRLRDREGSGNDAEARQRLLEMHPHALVIARLRKGGYLVGEAADDRNVYVNETEYSLAGLRKAEPRSLTFNVLPGTRPSRWIVLHETERWREWDFAASPDKHLTVAEEHRLLEVAADTENVLAVARDARKPHDDVTVWTLEGDGSWDPEHLLTVGISGPSMREREVRWARRPATARERARRGDWNEDGELLWTLSYGNDVSSRRGDLLPWENDPKHDDDEEDWRGWRPTRWAVSFVDEERVKRLRERRAAVREVRERARGLAETVERASASLAAQYLQPRYDAVWQRFLEDYGDAELWEGHAKANDLPEWPYGARRRWARDETPVWIRALRGFVEAGRDPWGMTAREVVSAVFADPELRFPYTSWEETRWEPTRGGGKVGKGKLAAEELPVLECEDDVADLRYDAEAKLVEPWAATLEAVRAREAEEEARLQEELDAEYAEEEDEPDFDVEAEAELEELPAPGETG